MKDGYWLVGFQYEVTGTLYSLGRIPQCKVAMLKHLKPGAKSADCRRRPWHRGN
jgi:hypothetical protein